MHRRTPCPFAAALAFFILLLFVTPGFLAAQATPPVPTNHVRIHYFRPDGNYLGWTASDLFHMQTQAEVQANLHFLNVGPSQTPGLIVMKLDANSGDFARYQHHRRGLQRHERAGNVPESRTGWIEFAVAPGSATFRRPDRRPIVVQLAERYRDCAGTDHGCLRDQQALAR